MVILLSHLGLPQTHKLLTEVPGVDVCLCAHTHDRITQPLDPNGTILIESGCQGAFLGELLLTLEDGRIVAYRTSADRGVRSGYTRPGHAGAGRTGHGSLPGPSVASSRPDHDTALDRSTCLEATLDNLLLKSMLAATGADVAFSNGWRYGAPIPAGPITREQLYNIIPMDPVISLVDLTGHEIGKMLETNLEKTFSGDAYEQAGGYVKRASGISGLF